MCTARPRRQCTASSQSHPGTGHTGSSRSRSLMSGPSDSRTAPPHTRCSPMTRCSPSSADSSPPHTRCSPRPRHSPSSPGTDQRHTRCTPSIQRRPGTARPRNPRNLSRPCSPGSVPAHTPRTPSPHSVRPTAPHRHRTAPLRTQCSPSLLYRTTPPSSVCPRHSPRTSSTRCCRGRSSPPHTACMRWRPRPSSDPPDRSCSWWPDSSPGPPRPPRSRHTQLPHRHRTAQMHTPCTASMPARRHQRDHMRSLCTTPSLSHCTAPSHRPRTESPTTSRGPPCPAHTSCTLCHPPVPTHLPRKARIPSLVIRHGRMSRLCSSCSWCARCLRTCPAGTALRHRRTVSTDPHRCHDIPLGSACTSPSPVASSTPLHTSRTLYWLKW